MAAPLAVITPLAMLAWSPVGAVVTLVATGLSGMACGEIELRLGKPASRTAFAKRGKGSFGAAMLGLFVACVGGGVAGTLTWLTCGHPVPLIVRNGSIVSQPPVRPGLPLGIGALGSVVGETVQLHLQPGDGVLVYTDGVTDSTMPDGSPFGEDRLADLLAREHAAGASPHEVVRRLLRTAIEHSADSLRDDATMVYIGWDPDAQGRH